MGYRPLPHELNQRHKTEDFEHLKIAHKLYTLGAVVSTTGRKVWWTQVENVGFRVWKYKQNSAWYRVLATKALRDHTIDDNLDASNTKHKH